MHDIHVRSGDTVTFGDVDLFFETDTAFLCFGAIDCGTRQDGKMFLKTHWFHEVDGDKHSFIYLTHSSSDTSDLVCFVVDRIVETARYWVFRDRVYLKSDWVINTEKVNVGYLCRLEHK